MIHISIRRYVARFTSASYLPCATSCAYLKSFLRKWFITMITDFVCTYLHHRKWCLLNHLQFIRSWMIKYSLFTIYILVCFRYKIYTYTTYQTINFEINPSNRLKRSCGHKILYLTYFITFSLMWITPWTSTRP